MAEHEHVDGGTYYSVDGKLHEIKRQLRQENGYPFSIFALNGALQSIIEGIFVFMKKLKGSTVGLHSDMLLGMKQEDVVNNKIIQCGTAVVCEALVPVQMADGGYAIVRYRHIGGKPDEILFIHSDDERINKLIRDSLFLPLISPRFLHRDVLYDVYVSNDGRLGPLDIHIVILHNGAMMVVGEGHYLKGVHRS